VNVMRTKAQKQSPVAQVSYLLASFVCGVCLHKIQLQCIVNMHGVA